MAVGLVQVFQLGINWMIFENHYYTAAKKKIDKICLKYVVEGRDCVCVWGGMLS